jgi:hypothetical protein
MDVRVALPESGVGIARLDAVAPQVPDPFAGVDDVRPVEELAPEHPVVVRAVDASERVRGGVLLGGLTGEQFGGRRHVVTAQREIGAGAFPVRPEPVGVGPRPLRRVDDAVEVDAHRHQPLARITASPGHVDQRLGVRSQELHVLTLSSSPPRVPRPSTHTQAGFPTSRHRQNSPSSERPPPHPPGSRPDLRVARSIRAGRAR